MRKQHDQQNKEHVKSGKAEEARLTDMNQKALDDLEKVKKHEKELEKEIGETVKSSTKTKKAKVRSKRYKQIRAKIDKNKKYKSEEAVDIVLELATASFDESVEVHMVLTDKLNGEVDLPYGTGKKQKIVICDDALLAKIEKNQLDFDVLIASPKMMPKLAKFARILGPKGLMPSPKSGTISENPEEVVKKMNAGSTRFKSEPKAPLMHFSIGKKSFGKEKLLANLKAFLVSVKRPNIVSVTIASTMGPSLKLDLEKI